MCVAYFYLYGMWCTVGVVYVGCGVGWVYCVIFFGLRSVLVYWWCFILWVLCMMGVVYGWCGVWLVCSIVGEMHCEYGV